MNYAELTRSLTNLGCCFRRHAKGGHEIWWHPQRRLYTVVPHHGKKDVAKGTLNKVLKDLGYTIEDLHAK